MFVARVDRPKYKSTPAHHAKPTANETGWLSYLPSWNSRSARLAEDDDGDDDSDDGRAKAPSKFQNPWPSFHRPTGGEIWEALVWGEDPDPSLELAASHIPAYRQLTREQQAASLLFVEKPDFTFDPTTNNAKATWLGHAGILLQLSPLRRCDRPIRCLFDPIFSSRVGPSEVVGPLRRYPVPCSIDALPAIDVVLISHSHFDHLDFDTITQVWKANVERVQFVVPLKNKQWFLDSGIPSSHVTELDWWESVTFSTPHHSTSSLMVTCTPAQHSSARIGFDKDSTLWSSWYLTHSVPERVFRVFFAGDTGYRFHSDPAWPPKPTPSSPPESTDKSDRPTRNEPSKERIQSTPGLTGSRRSKNAVETSPPCPAFREIVVRLRSPHLLFLPVALGATWSYLRGFFSTYLPDSIDPFPQHSPGLTGSIHMAPRDAVEVFREMAQRDSDTPSGGACMDPAVAVAMHWGTFVTDPGEILKTLGQLEWACKEHGVRFARKHPAANSKDSSSTTDNGNGVFVSLNHGQSIEM